MSNDLKRDYEKLLQDLESAKSGLVRAETNLEQKEKDLEKAEANLIAVAKTSDKEQIKQLLLEIDVELDKLINQARALFEEDNNV